MQVALLTLFNLHNLQTAEGNFNTNSSSSELDESLVETYVVLARIYVFAPGYTEE
jgi:hypothetical protein